MKVEDAEKIAAWAAARRTLYAVGVLISAGASRLGPDPIGKAGLVFRLGSAS